MRPMNSYCTFLDAIHASSSPGSAASSSSIVPRNCAR
ncbi:ORFL90C [Human betaherpesvirus 5]|nr:ORFL90C [Human betaherpesvirus 5]QHX40402.1 ORFL90C [Human betaherpesvirus 5]